MAGLFDDIDGLFDDLPNSLLILRTRVNQVINLCTVETANASRRWLEIKDFEKQVEDKDKQIEELEKQIENIRQSWWPTLREELAKPEYASFVTAKNAQGLFDYLNAKNITQQLDPIPIADIRTVISGVFVKLRLNTLHPDAEEDAKIKETWRGLLQEQLAVIGNATLIPAVQVQELAQNAIQFGLLPAGTVIGSKMVSRLEVLNLEGRVKSELDIIEAMGWASPTEITE